jgi:GDPmannose 4,6-dehydratase
MAESIKPGQTVVRIDPRYFRPTEVQSLLGDASKARRQLGWEPTVTFTDLLREMIAADLTDAQKYDWVRASGLPVTHRHDS